MPDRIDARVPVRLALELDAPVADGTLVLVEHGLDLRPPRAALALRPAVFAPAHDAVGFDAPSCLCCAGRAPFAAELGGLFGERAKGTAPFFRAVLAVGSPRGLVHARAALGSDPFLLGRYRLAEPLTTA